VARAQGPTWERDAETSIMSLKTSLGSAGTKPHAFMHGTVLEVACTMTESYFGWNV
jgi:hypothetical protein